jgi:hypothetical protein
VGAFRSGFVCDRVGELEPPPANELVQSTSTTNTKIIISNARNFYSILVDIHMGKFHSCDCFAEEFFSHES